MPRFRSLHERQDGWPITWRAKFFILIFGEMAVSDWLFPGGEPDRPLPWNARVKLMNGKPVVYFGSHYAALLLWPDGTTRPMAFFTNAGIVSNR